MSDPSLPSPVSLPPSSLRERVRRFEDDWRAGRRPRIEDYLAEVPDSERPALLRELLVCELALRRQQGQDPLPDEYLSRFPTDTPTIHVAFDLSPPTMDPAAWTGPHVPAGANSDPGTFDTGDGVIRAEADAMPARLGRYRIVARLGAGGFGVVYRGHDDELRRDVAIKVPHRHRLATAADAEAYLAEARILASLDHPAIVPVHDVGRTDDGLCYLVSKYVEGCDLAHRLQQGRPPLAETVEIVARVAEALHHAHQRGLVHRDVKGGNILLDSQGRPVVADFGLALREEDYDTGPNFAGTPAYMSPEQARGEGHRVDARTDVYSLGVVFYELLTGRRPFVGKSVDEVLAQVKTQEPRPPRQLDDAIPRELDRICLKCLCKRAADRFSTARDLAEDLRHWQTHAPVPPILSAATGPPPAATPASDSDRRPLRIVPRGLRSFDAADADFFLELLPGPRDRDGLPASVRFWKTHGEETDADRTFPVGLLYGPSGCGKSSLVKAGLLPRLAGHVVAVYVEATAEDTEARLLRGLRKHCPDLPPDRGLIETLAAVRRGRGLPADRKLLLVFDQLEQWLHAHRRDENAELVQALRQCDGDRVQALVLVRDDFWVAATRFLHDLEFPLLEGKNSALADLFDARHARKVLMAFGRAYGALPDDNAELPAEASRFLDQVVDGLAADGKVISVRLALFAEMVKGRPWTPATLRAVGGTAGVGVAFLEETFGAATAPLEHRYHQRAARAVLKALLPEQGTDIKGQMCPEAELRRRAGYTDRPRDWAQLTAILDGSLRLITPTDPEGREEDAIEAAPAANGERYYQLTHDYLVPALREWLTRKQRETRRGRAELRLAERAAAWTARPERRHLPGAWEWLTIRLLTRKRDWTTPQRTMMRRAARLHGARLAGLVVLLAVLGWGAWETVGALRAAALVRALAAAETTDVPGLVAEIRSYRRWADPLLIRAAAEAEPASKEHLHAALALLPVDASQADYLAERLLTARPDEVLVLRDALRGRGEGLAERFAAVMGDRKTPPGQRLRAACALATLAPEGLEWPAWSAEVVDALVKENVLLVSKWTEALRPVRGVLLSPLAVVFRAADRPEGERSVATSLLADFAADRPDVLTHLLLDADARAYAVFFPLLEAHRERAMPLLNDELEKTATGDWKDGPLAAAWTAPAANLTREVEAARGWIGERFALCQTLPLERFDAGAGELRRGGYRPIRLRPYKAGQSVQVAAVWTRDGRAWQAAHGLSAAEVRTQVERRRRQGYQPVDVAGYLDGGQGRYAVLGVKGGKDDEAQLYVGVPEDRHKVDGWGPLRPAKLNPATMHVLYDREGEVRYSSVWRKTAPAGNGSWGWDEETMRDKPLSEGLPGDVCVNENPRHARDVRAELLAWLSGSPWPGLGLRCRSLDEPHPERRYAGSFRADATIDHVQELGLSPEEQVRRGRELAAQGYRPVALSVAEIEGRLVTASVWHRPVVPEEAKERLVKRQASAAVALLRLGQAKRVWPLLRHQPDPRLRSYLIHRLSPLGADARSLVRRLTEEPDVSVRRALLLCLGEFGYAHLPAAEGAALVPTLEALYRDDPDPGLHGAAEWLLRQWNQAAKLHEIDRALAGREPPAGRRWYVNGQGQTFVLVPGPVEFVMGSPRTEAEREGGAEGKLERQHRRRIDRTFALAAKEVTVEQYLRFRKDYGYNKQYSPTPAHPVNGVSWYEAAAYCNWLSKQEGIPEGQWCYVPNAQGQLSEGMRMKPDYLNLRGYRLPTEAEWEYACRAGAVTSRYYGETDELLGRYAWYTKNSLDKGMLLPGSLKPNDLGLFDLYGNAYEWCQDGIFYYPKSAHGKPAPDNGHNGDTKYIRDKLSRVLRGGSFASHPRHVRSAYRNRYAPTNRLLIGGFRPARTFR